MPRAKSDPLLAALIKKLPSAGTEWPVEQQLGWLRLMAMAFGTVYGGDVAAMLAGNASDRKSLSGADVARPKPVPSIEYPFYIDKNSYARKRGGTRILPKEVGGTLTDLRGIDGDLSAIIWADDSKGIGDAPSLMIEAA